MRFLRRSKAAVVIVAVLAATAVAQAAGVYLWEEPPAAGENRRPYGTTKPADEELLVPVSIWGEVEKPGLYNVPDGTDLTQLISYAGGPTEYANLTKVKLTRPGAGDANAVNVNRYLDSGDAALVPALQPGDTVYVRKNKRYAWRTFIEVVSEFAVIAGTVLLYIEVTGKK